MAASLSFVMAVSQQHQTDFKCLMIHAEEIPNSLSSKTEQTLAATISVLEFRPCS